MRCYVKLIPPSRDKGLVSLNTVFTEVGGGLIHIVPEIVIYANDPNLPQIGNAEVLNLENREVTSMQEEQWPGRHEEGGGEAFQREDHRRGGAYQMEDHGRGGAFQRGERHRHSTIGTQWQPQSIDSKFTICLSLARLNLPLHDHSTEPNLRLLLFPMLSLGSHFEHTPLLLNCWLNSHLRRGVKRHS